MSYKAIYAYAWDLAEIGVASAAARFRALGLDTVTIAGSYHAGKFLRPHSRAGKVYFPEDGTVDRPTERLYGTIKPLVSRIARERDVLRELCESGAIGVNVWLVLLHNTKLGEAHPDQCVTNAFGDRYIYNLCPAVPAARAYALGLCQDSPATIRCAGCRWRRPAFYPTRTASITSSRSSSGTGGWKISLACASATTACRARRRPASTPPLLSRRVRNYVELVSVRRD